MALKQIGALWLKEDKNQHPYKAGTLDLGALGHISVMVFPTKDKTGNMPDYQIYRVEPEQPGQ